MFPAFVGHLFPVTKGKLAGALQVLNFPIFPFFMRGTLGRPNPQPDTFLPGNSVHLYLRVYNFSWKKKCPFFFFKDRLKSLLSNPSPRKIPKFICKQAEFQRLDLKA